MNKRIIDCMRSMAITECNGVSTSQDTPRIIQNLSIRRSLEYPLRIHHNAMIKLYEDVQKFDDQRDDCVQVIDSIKSRLASSCTRLCDSFIDEILLLIKHHYGPLCEDHELENLIVKENLSKIKKNIKSIITKKSLKVSKEKKKYCFVFGFEQVNHSEQNGETLLTFDEVLDSLDENYKILPLGLKSVLLTREDKINNLFHPQSGLMSAIFSSSNSSFEEVLDNIGEVCDLTKEEMPKLNTLLSSFIEKMDSKLDSLNINKIQNDFSGGIKKMTENTSPETWLEAIGSVGSIVMFVSVVVNELMDWDSDSWSNILPISLVAAWFHKKLIFECFLKLKEIVLRMEPQSGLVDSIRNFVVFALTCFVSGKQTAFGTLETLYKNIGNYHNIERNFENIVDYVLQTLVKIVDWFNAGEYLPDSIRYANVGQFDVKNCLIKCTEFLRKYERNDLPINEVTYVTVCSLYNECEFILTDRQCNLKGSVLIVIRENKRLLQIVRAAVGHAIGVKDGRRAEPVSIMFRGSPGSFKSQCADFLNTRLLMNALTDEELVEYSSDLSRLIYNRCAETKFWDGMTQSKMIALFDDFMQVKDVAGVSDCEAMDYIRAVNEQPYLLHMASVEQKGNFFFRCKYVVATTNLREVKPESIIDPSALKRRFDIALTVCAKREFSLNPNADVFDRKVDVSKLPRGPLGEPNIDPSCLEFHVFDLLREKHTGEIMDFEGVVKYALSKREQKDLWYNQKSTQMNDIITKELSKRGLLKLKPQSGRLANIDTLADAYTMQDIASLIDPEHEDEGFGEIGLHSNYVDLPPPFTPDMFHTLPLSHQLKVNRVNHFFAVHNRMFPDYQFDDSDVDGVIHFIRNYGVGNDTILESMMLLFPPSKACKRRGWNLGDIMRNLKVGIAYNIADIKSMIDTCYNCIMRVNQRATFNIAMQCITSMYVQPFFSIFAGYLIVKIVQFLGYKTGKMKKKTGKKDLTQVLNEAQSFKHKTDNGVKAHNKSLTIRLRDLKPQMGNNIDAQATQILENVRSTNSFEISMSKVQNDDMVVLGYGLVVKANIMIIPAHFVSLAIVGMETDPLFASKTFKFERPSKKGQNVVYKTTVKEFVDSVFIDEFLEEKDLAVVNMPRDFKPCTDITKFICTENDLASRGRFMAQLYKPSLAYGDRLFLYAERAQSECFVSQNELEYTLRNGFVYQSNTDSGDCGSLLFIMDPGTSCRKIFGIHVAGNKNGAGYATPLTQEIVQHMLKVSPAQIEDLELENYAPHCGFTVVDDRFAPLVKYHKSYFAPTTTILAKSNLYEKWGPAKTKPAILHPFVSEIVGEVDPLRNFLMKMCNEPAFLNKELIDKCALVFSNKIKSIVGREVEPTTFTYEQAVCGVSYDRNFGPIPRGTSMGIPWKDSARGRKGKTALWGVDAEPTWNSELNKRLRKRVFEAIDHMRHGRRPLFIYQDFLKDERLKIEKAESGRTRGLSCSPVDFTVLCRMYFGSFCLFLINNWSYVAVGLGANPFSEDWDFLARHLQKFKTKDYVNNVFAGDFKNFDGSLQAYIMWKILDVIQYWYGLDNPDNKIRQLLFYDIVFSRHLYEDKVYEWNGSLPSGNPLTPIVNSLYNHIAHIYAWSRATGSHPMYFWNHVTMVTLGDDSVVHVDETCADVFNELSVIEYFKELGLTYTTDTKEYTGNTLRPLSQVTFLKRSFRYSKEAGRFVAPLDLDVIKEMPYWTKKIDKGNNIVLTTTQTALHELALHGRTVFDEVSKPILEAHKKVFGFYPEVSVYEILLDQALKLDLIL